jgi:hypothetical protein
MLRTRSVAPALALALTLAPTLPACDGSTEVTTSTTSATTSTTGSGGGGGGQGGGGGHGGAGGGGGVAPASLAGKAFDVTLRTKEGDEGFCQGACAPATILVASATDAEIQAVWGRKAHAVPMKLTAAASGFALAEPVVIGAYQGWKYSACPDTWTLEAATFDLADHDGDGRPDLAASGHVVAKICSDDYEMTEEYDVVIAGAPDARAPKLLGPLDAFVPTDALTLDLDKPLAADATATLGAPLGLALEPRVEAGFVVGFATDVVLPIGATVTATVTGLDFAGVGTPAPLTVPVLADFGVLADGGFEGGGAAGVHAAAIVDAFGVVPAIAGAKMLHVRSGDRGLLRLARAGGEAKVAMSVRVVDECAWEGATGALTVRAAVVGAKGTTSTSPSFGATFTAVEVNGATAHVGELTTVSLDLPVGPGGDVLVEIVGDDYQGAGCARAGALIDDVHLE